MPTDPAWRLHVTWALGERARAARAVPPLPHPSPGLPEPRPAGPPPPPPKPKGREFAPTEGAALSAVTGPLRTDLSQQPQGFSCVAKNVGIKDDTLDFTVVDAGSPAAAAATFTRSAFCGHAVTVGRAHAADGRIRAVVVNSKNANVATGPEGLAACEETCRLVGAELGAPGEDIFPCSTGVIGLPLPMERIRAGVRGLRGELAPGGLEGFARAILTTDTRPKMRSARVGDAIIAGCCKGSGMIAPNMATMLAFFFTDAAVAAPDLGGMLRRATDVSFNMVSVDGDTSTSDTALALANGRSGPVDAAAFERALTAMAVELAKEVARDGEGATKLLEVTVGGAPDPAAARSAAKSIVNSPLCKAAVWGADPNWGRVVMALGKCFDLSLDPAHLRIAFGDVTVYAGGPVASPPAGPLAAYLRGDMVAVRVDLGLGTASATAWGCDLTPEYVHINGDYTT